MSGSIRKIVEVPCMVETIPPIEVLRQLAPEALQALAINPADVVTNIQNDPAKKDHGDTTPEMDPAQEIELTKSTSLRIDTAIAACLATYEPRGAYKIFNPTICTLPPKYTEPAIKLVGTMMIFRGQSIYDRLRRAAHCALLAVTIGSENPAALPTGADDLDRAIAQACARALVECAADRVNAAIISAALEEELYTDDRLRPGDGDFPTDTRSQLIFYTQSEKRLGLKLDSEGAFDPPYSTVGVVGLYDPSQKNRRRACGRCKHREYCTIRSIGMTCHGSKGSFAKS